VCGWKSAQQETGSNATLDQSSGSAARSLEEAARNLITQYNITVIVASGNSQEDSCYIAPGQPQLHMQMSRNFS